MSENNKQEMEQELFRTRNQLTHQIQINQALQKELGEYAGKYANMKVTSDALKSYAEKLEGELAVLNSDQQKQEKKKEQDNKKPKKR